MVKMLKQMKETNHSTGKTDTEMAENGPCEQKEAKDEKILQQQLQPEMMNDLLSDQTSVQGSSWSTLKHFAMMPDYQTSSWFCTYTQEEQKTVQRLVEAQKAQGNMNEL